MKSSHENHCRINILNFSESDPETVRLIVNGQDKRVLVAVVLNDVVVHVDQDTSG